jgi:hypothetical protein
MIATGRTGGEATRFQAGCDVGDTDTVALALYVTQVDRPFGETAISSGKTPSGRTTPYVPSRE